MVAWRGIGGWYMTSCRSLKDSGPDIGISFGFESAVKEDESHDYSG